ncbi:MAG: sulfite exporter TauE/SafE family protein [Lysobacterales bacterium]
MIAELSLGAALLLGAAGSVHCVLMCGAIAGAFGVSSAGRAPIVVPLAASLGRILGYAGLGALFGLFGLGIGSWLEQPSGIWVLRAMAALVLVLMGLQLAGWISLLDRLAVIGAPLWRRLQPLTRRLLPIDSAAKGLAFGALWGLLPCGLVYGMLTLSIGFASPVQGALFMAAFGLGTLPAMLGLGVAAGASTPRGLSANRKRQIGAALAVFGVFFFLAPWILPHEGPLSALRPLLDCH